MKKNSDGFSAKDHMRFIAKNLHKPIKNLSNQQYHGVYGCWSSSQFKDILEDEDLFVNKYIKRTVERKELEVFDTGTCFHTLVLEPHKLEEEIAIFDGKTRYGTKWDNFKKLNPGKMAITSAQFDQSKAMAKSVKASPVAMEYLRGDPEVSLFIELHIDNGKVFAPRFGKVLTPEGWEIGRGTPSEGAYVVVVKVRADCLGASFVSDLKSTSKNARHEKSIRSAISDYKYDLSAALYLDMFSLINPAIREFIWVFASKSSQNCGTWRATPNQIKVGRAKYVKAMIKLADLAAAKWELVDCLREAEPMPWEMEWLREKETDLL